MVHLEHLNLVVRDIPASVKFYQAAFPHWRIRQQGESQWNGKDRKWLHIGDDYQYLTDKDHDGAIEPFRKNVYYVDPNGFEVEFVEYLSDDPEERNRPS